MSCSIEATIVAQFVSSQVLRKSNGILETSQINFLGKLGLCCSHGDECSNSGGNVDCHASTVCSDRDDCDNGGDDSAETLTTTHQSYQICLYLRTFRKQTMPCDALVTVHFTGSRPW